jgi:histidinol phosphatase-like enzyme (inositol monophosphatase family)
MNAEWTTRYECAVQTTRAAAALALDYYHQALDVEWKADESPVTVADREAERLLRETLLGSFPGDGFLGEESGDQPAATDFQWIIDPIDGTRNFVRGIPIWGTMTGLLHRGEPIAGVIACPALGHLWHAVRGGGAFRNDKPIRVSEVARLAESTLTCTSADYFLRTPEGRPGMAVLARAQISRGYGDCWGFALVAQGSADAMIDHGMKPWDIAAAVPIVEEAGGRASNWNGGRDLFRSDWVASNGRLHDAILAEFQAAEGRS